jgi:ParB-like chromosome segregation protein Spo0J
MQNARDKTCKNPTVSAAVQTTRFAASSAAIMALAGLTDIAETGVSAKPARRRRSDRPEPASLPAMQPWTPALQIIPIERLVFNPAQPRGDAEADLDGLVASLDAVSEPYLVQPPTVEALPDGTYLIQMGERRIRSVMQAGWQRVVCLVIGESDPFTGLMRRLAENMQRRDLHPLDEAASLKNAWLYANAAALGAEADARTILAEGLPPLVTLDALTGLLAERGFVPTHPPVTRQQVLARLGLVANAEKCKQLLKLLALDTEVLRAVRDLDMTEAAIRCLGRFALEQQRMLVAEIRSLPALARQVRAIWVAMQKDKSSFDEALDAARRRALRIAEAKAQPPDELPDASALDDLDDLTAAIEAQAAAADDGPPALELSGSEDEIMLAAPGPATQIGGDDQVDENDAMERALTILEAANAIQASGADLVALLDGRSLGAFPEPWRGYVLTAAQIIAATLKSLPLQDRAHESSHPFGVG